MEKERPAELNKKIKRLKCSRDNLKECNRQKTQINKKLRDRTVEITTSRDSWRKQCENYQRAQEEFEQKLEISLVEVEKERARANVERERAEKLEIEIEKIRGEKSRS
jgi:hypothetical protein